MTDTGIWSVRAEAAMAARRWDDALVHLRRLIEEVARIDFEYEEWLRSTAECFAQMGRHLESQACHAYLNSLNVPSPESLAGLVGRARMGDALALRGIRLTATYLSRGGHHEAAEEAHHGDEKAHAGGLQRREGGHPVQRGADSGCGEGPADQAPILMRDVQGARTELVIVPLF